LSDVTLLSLLPQDIPLDGEGKALPIRIVSIGKQCFKAIFHAGNRQGYARLLSTKAGSLRQVWKGFCGDLHRAEKPCGGELYRKRRSPLVGDTGLKCFKRGSKLDLY
jgi:hypothetical protein